MNTQNQLIGGAGQAGPQQGQNLTKDQQKMLAQMLLAQGMNGTDPNATAAGGMAVDQGGAALANGAAGVLGAYLMGNKKPNGAMAAGAPGLALLGNGGLPVA